MFEFISGRLLVALITLTCSTSFLLFGYDQGVLSGIIGANNQFGEDFNHPNVSTQGLIVSVYQLGNVAGSAGIFFLGDSWGRRKSIIYATAVMLLGAILQTAAIDRPMMYAARVITGIVTTPLPKSEIMQLLINCAGQWRKHFHGARVAGRDKHGQRERKPGCH